ncbi:hypothetical protein [Pectinatus frisingensis]|nr:hypothetical protein [Pectinatus frisingensis]
MKVMIFGTGEDYQKYKEWFKNTEIIALLDMILISNYFLME